jgi:tetratricopeptide (TPR) repeat protein
LVRDDSAHPALADANVKLPGTSTYAPRLSPEDFEREVEDHATDRNRAIDERMPSVLTLAGLDLAHKRFPQAISKYQLAARYYGGIGRLALYALALNGIGEVHARAERPNDALAYFESALTPAFQRLEQKDDAGRVDAVPVLLNITLNLANLYLAQKRWSEAGGYYEAAKGIAHGMAHTQVEVQCWENIGVCHYQLGQSVEALRAWEAGSALARTFEAFEHLHNLLVRQRDAYHALHMGDRYEATLAELRQLDAHLEQARRSS